MDPTANLDKIGIWCNSSHQDTDLWLLPEMFNTGYSLDPSKMSVEWQGACTAKGLISPKFSILYLSF